MTGLFGRLAQQAAGAGPPRVRSAAALPFAPAPPLAEAPGLEPAADTGPEAMARTVPSPLLAPAPMPDAVPTAPQTPALAAVAEPEAERTAEGPAARPETAPMAERDAPMTLHEVAARLVATPKLDATPAPRLAQPGQVQPPSLLRPQPPLPQPLLPEARVVPPVAPRAPTRQAVAAPSPEVHVHIGRIEVTSLPEPATAPAPRAPRGRPPMSLAQYLDKRRGS